MKTSVVARWLVALSAVWLDAAGASPSRQDAYWKVDHPCELDPADCKKVCASHPGAVACDALAVHAAERIVATDNADRLEPAKLLELLSHLGAICDREVMQACNAAQDLAELTDSAQSVTAGDEAQATKVVDRVIALAAAAEQAQARGASREDLEFVTAIAKRFAPFVARRRAGASLGSPAAIRRLSDGESDILRAEEMVKWVLSKAQAAADVRVAEKARQDADAPRIGAALAACAADPKACEVRCAEQFDLFACHALGVAALKVERRDVAIFYLKWACDNGLFSACEACKAMSTKRKYVGR
jgi:hypothetical protein